MMPDTDEIRDIPPHIIKNNSNVSLYIDVIHINGIMFLVGTLKHIGFVQFMYKKEA